MSDLYTLTDVTQFYGQRCVLDIPDLRLESRRIIGLAGPNGSGKSTLMRLLAFLETPATGSISYCGRACDGSVEAMRSEVTLLTQEPYLLKRSVGANVGYGLQVRGVRGTEAQVDEALDMVGLPARKFARRAWFELSGGEAQRVALAARLALRPQVLLLDEPTASLDEASAKLIRTASLAAREKWGTTLVVVSHDQDWLDSVSDEKIFLRDGRLMQGPGA